MVGLAPAVHAQELPDARTAEGWRPAEGLPHGPRPGLPARAQADSAHSFDVRHYRLDLDIPCSGTSLSGTCAITLNAVTAGLSLVELDFDSLRVDGVTQDGIPTAFTVLPGLLRVHLLAPLAAGDSTVLRITYHGPAQKGFFQAYPETWFSFTEPSNARFWFPCYDQPWDKATSEVHLTVPDSMFVASNGVQLAPPATDALAHKKTYRWGTQYPLATYLISIAVANYVELRDSANYVPLRSYVLKADSAKAVADFQRLPAMINFFGSLWGQYPFEKYGMAATKNFGGGMEHQTMTTVTRNWIRGDRKYEWAIAHELAHQWWGDMVTCVDWSHVWVNEGFASYADMMFTEHTYGLDSARVRLREWEDVYFMEDSLIAYPVGNPPPNKLFGTAVYYKGAWILHMLRHQMGDSAFVRGWRDYGNFHKYGNGSIADFQAAMEPHYGKSLGWFFDQWLYQSGYPRYRVTRNSLPRAGGGWHNYVTLEQVQTTGPIFSMPVDLRLLGAGLDSTVTVWNDRARISYHFENSSRLDSVVLDPGVWLLARRAPDTSELTSAPEPGPPTVGFRAVRWSRGVVDLEYEFPDALRGVPSDLTLYDVQGRRGASLWAGPALLGSQRQRWRGEGLGGGILPSGLYFARLSAGDQSRTARILWLR